MWFVLALLSMLAYGALDFLFKVAGEMRLDFSNLLLYYYWTASFSAFVLFAFSPEPITDFPVLAFFAVVQVSFYLLTNVLKLESLKRIKSVFAYPLFALHGVVASVFAWAFLGESLALPQYIGIALSVVAILLLIEKRHHIRLSRGVLYALGAMVFLAVSETIVAAVIDKLVFLPFIAFSYFFAIGPSFILEEHLHKRAGKREGTLKMGVAMGLTNVLAFYTLLLALREGLVSVVFPIIALALLVSVVLSIAVYKEEISRMKAVAIALALLALIVINL